VARISRWATESLFPTLTIVIDLPAEIGLGRLKSKDRLEAQPIDFHERVRHEFLQLASLDPERYFIINGNKSIEEIHTAIITRVSEIAALKRNAVEDKGNLLLRPIRAASKEVKKIGNTASKAVKSRSNSSKSVKAKPTKKKPAAKK
jgi:dTMP kinase